MKGYGELDWELVRSFCCLTLLMTPPMHRRSHPRVKELLGKHVVDIVFFIVNVEVAENEQKHDVRKTEAEA